MNEELCRRMHTKGPKSKEDRMARTQRWKEKLESINYNNNSGQIKFDFN